MFAPLVVRGQQLGVMSFFNAPTRSAFGENHLRVAEEYADRVALAYENSRLFREARDAVRMRDEFVALATHELKTPVTALKLQAQLLKEKVFPLIEAEESRKEPENETAPQGLDHLTRIAELMNRSASNLNELINHLFDVTGMRAGKLKLTPEWFELDELASEVVENLGPLLQANRCELQIHAAPIRVYWDRVRMEQVLVNLVTNAAKYAPGTVIGLFSRCVENGVRVTVSDHGPGIPRESQEKIFELFERINDQTSSEGLGLGLFVVRSIVAAHQGRVWVESAPGTGATFHVELPLEYKTSSSSSIQSEEDRS